MGYDRILTGAEDRVLLPEQQEEIVAEAVLVQLTVFLQGGCNKF